MNMIKVQTGLKNIPVYDENDKQIGTFQFRPADALRIYSRMQNGLEKLQETLKPLETLDSSGDGRLISEFPEVYGNVEKGVYAWFEDVFKADSYKAFFSVLSPLATVDGNFYCLAVIEALTALMAEEMTAGLDQTGKYLAAYEA